MGEGLGLNVVDAVIIGVIVISAVMSLVRGFVREVFSVVAFIGAAFATIVGYPHVKPIAQGFLGQTITADLAALIGIFVVVYILISIISGQLTALVRSIDEVSMIDRVAGLIFGAARGVFILALAAIVIEAVVPQNSMPNLITESRTYPIISSTAKGLQAIFPKEKLADGAKKLGDAITAAGGSAPPPAQ